MRKREQSDGIDTIFGCDIRSLAALRIGVALILLADLVFYFLNFKAFFTETGIFPRELTLHISDQPTMWSLFYLSTGTWLPLSLLCISVFSAVAMLLGWKTRLFTVLNWILVVSTQVKAPLVMQSGDVLIRLLLFWGMFLPWGATCSLDHILEDPQQKQSPKTTRVLSVATLAYVIQIICVYVFAVMLKTGKEWRSEGSAVYYALHIDDLVTPLGKWLATLPYPFLQFLSFSVFILEGLCPLFLLSPWFRLPLRVGALLTLWSLHIGFGSSLNIGTFTFASIVSTFGFIPTEVWDFIGSHLSGIERIHTFFRSQVLKFQSSLKKWSVKESLFQLSILEKLFCAYALVFVLCWNLSQLPGGNPNFGIARPNVAFFLRLDQRWDMFTPFPLKESGWYIVKAKLMSGREIDLFRDQKKDFRWRKYMEMIRAQGFSAYRDYYAHYLCSNWNDDRLKFDLISSVDIIFMKREIPPPGNPFPEPGALPIWHRQCF